MKILVLPLLLFFLTFIIFIQDAHASTSTAGYRSNTGTCATDLLNCPKVTSKVGLPTADSPVREAVIKYSPVVSSKIVLITLSNDGFLDAYVCTSNCGTADSWTVTNNIGQVWTAAAAQRRFDVEFETASGDALVVYGVLSTNVTRDLAYKVLPSASSNFTGITEQYINDAGHDTDIQYTWVALDRDPVGTSEELIVVGFDSTDSDINAWVWSGTAWGNQQELTAAATATGEGEALAVKYAADGGIGMVMGGDSTAGSVAVFHWTGAAWVNTADFDVDTGDSLDVKWLTLKADPATDDLQAVAVDSGSDLHTAYWSGTAWNVTSNIDAAVDSNTERPADFEWDPSGSTGRLVWDTDTTGTTLSQRPCSPECTGTTSTISTYAGTGAWLALYRNPTDAETVNILGGRLNSNFDIGSFTWNGISYINNGDSSITADTTVSTFEAFTFAFQLPAPPDTTPPLITVQSPTNTSTVFTNVWANVTLDEDGSVVFRSLDGGANVSLANSSGNWNNLMTDVPGGPHNVKFYANDTSGNQATPVNVNFTVTKSLIVTLDISSVDFGSLISGTRDTLAFSPPPFVLINDGNVDVNTTIDSTNLWSASSNPNPYFQFNTSTNESGAVPDTSTTYVNSNESFPTKFVNTFYTWMSNRTRWQNSTDALNVHINITVPFDETGASKSATVTIIATEA